MTEVSQVLASRNYRTIETKVTNPSIESIGSIELGKYSNTPVMTTEQADAVMADCSDLIADVSYKPYFFKRLYALGPVVFTQLAMHARKYGKYPDRLFVKLLKQQGGK